MNKSQKVTLKNFARYIDQKKVAFRHPWDYAVHDTRPLPSEYLLSRVFYGADEWPPPPYLNTPVRDLASRLGMTEEQIHKMDRLAASTHSPKQRATRVANYLRKVVDIPGYMGRG